MQQKKFQYRIEAVVEFTPAEVQHLMRISTRHYDQRCRAQSQKDGFIYDMDVQRTFNEHPETDLVEWSLTWHQLDTLCKITEMERAYAPEDPQLHLHYSLVALFHEMREQSQKINN